MNDQRDGRRSSLRVAVIKKKGNAYAMSRKRTTILPVVLEANEDGYLASVPSLQGAFAEGDAVEEAVLNCIEVAKMILAYRAERSEVVGLGEMR